MLMLKSWSRRLRTPSRTARTTCDQDCVASLAAHQAMGIAMRVANTTASTGDLTRRPARKSATQAVSAAIDTATTTTRPTRDERIMTFAVETAAGRDRASPSGCRALDVIDPTHGPPAQRLPGRAPKPARPRHDPALAPRHSLSGLRAS